MIAVCRFANSERSYEYIAPFPVTVGQFVWVATKRGEVAVEVVAIKDKSDTDTVELLRPWEKPIPDTLF
jgi:hypothetical protein